MAIGFTSKYKYSNAQFGIQRGTGSGSAITQPIADGQKQK